MLKANSIILATLIWGQVAAANSFGNPDDAPYEVCALCHSLDGVSHMAKFPKLAGQPAPYIEKQLHDFLNGRRTNDGGQMSAIVTEITPDKFPIVAEWFANLEPPLPEDAEDVSVGQLAFEYKGCVNCHILGRASDEAPHLTAQHAAYLEKQMVDFREGHRTNDTDGMMQAAMANVTDSEIAEIAAYLAATAR